MDSLQRMQEKGSLKLEQVAGLRASGGGISDQQKPEIVGFELSLCGLACEFG